MQLQRHSCNCSAIPKIGKTFEKAADTGSTLQVPVVKELDTADVVG
jgi:hypothetical protein